MLPVHMQLVPVYLSCRCLRSWRWSPGWRGVDTKSPADSGRCAARKHFDVFSVWTYTVLKWDNSICVTHVRVGSFDGELVDPLVVVDHAVGDLAGDQLIAQHPPGQPEVHHALHCSGPVVQRHVTWRRRKYYLLFQRYSHPCIVLQSDQWTLQTNFKMHKKQSKTNIVK